MTLVAPFGFFGCGNIGDEATLQGFAQIAETSPRVRAWIAAHDHRHTARVEPRLRYYRATQFDARRWFVRRRADVHAFVGGTPIMDVHGAWPLARVAKLVTWAHARRRPIGFIGAGVETLRHSASRRIVADVLAPRVTAWSVRSPRDRDRLVCYGVPAERVTVTADLAWALRPVSAAFGERYLASLGLERTRPLVGVNLTNEPFVRERAPRLADRVAATLDRLVDKTGAHVLFFCSEVRDEDAFDAAAARAVRGRMARAEHASCIPNRYFTPQQLMSLMATCAATLTMRYHVSIFSALQQVPFVALTRSDKLHDLCVDLAWPFAASLVECEAQLLERCLDAIDRGPELGARLGRQLPRLRERSLQNRLTLDALHRRRS